VNAPADGHTLLLAAQPNAVDATLYPRPGFNFMRDIVPVTGIIRMPKVVLVHPSCRPHDHSRAHCGYRAEQWYGLGAPRDTPATIASTSRPMPRSRTLR